MTEAAENKDQEPKDSEKQVKPDAVSGATQEMLATRGPSLSETFKSLFKKKKKN